MKYGISTQKLAHIIQDHPNNGFCGFWRAACGRDFPPVEICQCAERAMAHVDHPDPRSIAAIKAKRQWLAGDITDEELTRARSAAWVAAWPAARDAAKFAACDAARDAAAAYATERKAQIDMLIEMLLEAQL